MKYRTFLWKNHAEKMHQKLAPDPFLILLNNPKQPLHARNSLLNKISWKRIIKKPFNRQSYQKQKESGTSNWSLFKLQNKFKNIPLLVILSGQVWWCNVKPFLGYSKIYIWKFMQASSWHHKLFHFHLPFWSKIVWKGREKITKNWISRERKELLRWNKKHLS